jgi:two-component system sensor histidine kinase KdpD
LAVLLVVASTGIFLFQPSSRPPTYRVLLAGGNFGRLFGAPSLLVSFLSVLAFDFFFVPPFLTFAVSDTEYILTFIVLFVVGLVISQLTTRVREQAEVAMRREADTATLYALSRDLSIAEGLDEVIHAISENVSQTFGREVMIFMPGRSESEGLTPYLPNPNIILDSNEAAVAAWSFQHGQ